MTANPWSTFRGQRVLLLQGPVGPFFNRLGRSLRQAGAQVHKINFNGGDWVFHPFGATSYRGALEEWPAYLERFLTERNIDVVMLFGDCRPIHAEVREICCRRGIKVGAFEEGYIRPNYVTFEQGGVNGFSMLANAWKQCQEQPARLARPERQLGSSFWYAALWAVLYYIAADLRRFAFRRYEHHRPLTILEGLPWLRGALRKVWYRIAERDVMSQLTGPLSRQFFLVPLQISTDSQIQTHSAYGSIEEFVRDVIRSFARHAPAGTALAIKHHPFDRGYHDYSSLIRRFAASHGVAERVLYLHDQHLPTLFEHMRGAVVINSTVGFSALSHNGAVKSCGRSIYDLPRLTYQGALAHFWVDSEHFRPDRDHVERFRAYVINETQLNGSFYRGEVPLGLSASMVAGTRPYPADALRPVPVRIADDLCS